MEEDEKPTYQEIYDAVADFCDENDIPFGEPEEPISVDPFVSSLYTNRILIANTYVGLTYAVQIGVTAALGILNGISSSLPQKIADATDELQSGIGG